MVYHLVSAATKVRFLPRGGALGAISMREAEIASIFCARGDLTTLIIGTLFTLTLLI